MKKKLKKINIILGASVIVGGTAVAVVAQTCGATSQGNSNQTINQILISAFNGMLFGTSQNPGSHPTNESNSNSFLLLSTLENQVNFILNGNSQEGNARFRFTQFSSLNVIFPAVMITSQNFISVPYNAIIAQGIDSNTNLTYAVRLSSSESGLVSDFIIDSSLLIVGESTEFEIRWSGIMIESL